MAKGETQFLLNVTLEGLSVAQAAFTLMYRPIFLTAKAKSIFLNEECHWCVCMCVVRVCVYYVCLCVCVSTCVCV